jgi:hypothetical protein
MAWKHFNIGKANAENERLETENANLTKRVAELEAAQKAITDNESDVAKAATELTARLDVANKRIAELEKERDQLKADVKTAEASAAKKALEITGAQGQPPVTQSGNGQGGANDLLVQYNSIQDPRARMEWYRKNKAAYDAQWAAAQKN